MSIYPITILGHYSQLREEYSASLKEAQQDGIKWHHDRNSRVAWQDYGRSKGVGWRKKSPQSNKARPLREASRREMRNQKTVHAIRCQEWVAKCTNEPPDHGKRMSSRQTLDVHRTRAGVRPKHHQPVPSQYKNGESWVRGKRGYGLAMGRRESLF